MEVPDEQLEAVLSETHTLLAVQLRDKLRAGEATPQEMKLALDLCKANRITDGGRPKDPSGQVADKLENLPFDSVDQEIA